MNIEQVCRHILKNPIEYPGLHLTPQPRSTPACQPLEPLSQMLLVWKSTIQYINENILEGRGVNIKNFGAFAFEIDSDLPRAASSNLGFFNPAKGEIEVQRAERRHIHKLRPVFVPDPSFQYVLARYKPSDLLGKPQSQHSIYQKGFRMLYCNPVPIASSCYFSKQMVACTHEAIFKAIKDLTQQGRTIELSFNFAALVIRDRNLKVTFSNKLNNQMNQPNMMTTMKRSQGPVSSLWKVSYNSKWQVSSLSNLHAKPEIQQTLKMNEKTLALRIMSLDMASSLVNSPGSRPITQNIFSQKK